MARSSGYDGLASGIAAAEPMLLRLRTRIEADGWHKLEHAMPGLKERAKTLVELLRRTLHELGHHLSMGPRSPQNVTLACECAADFWSITDGAFLLSQRSGRTFRLDLAVQEFSCILTTDLTSISLDRNRLPECWSHTWSVRKKALLRRTPIAFFLL